MKKITLSLVAFMASLLMLNSGCEKLKEAFTFHFNIGGEVTIPANIPPNIPYSVPAVGLPFNASEVYSTNQTAGDLIKEINLESFTLTITEPMMVDFDFMDKIEISFEKEGLPDKLVAWIDEVPADAGQTLDLEVTPDLLNEYLLTDGIKIKVKVITKSLNSQAIKINNAIRIRVRADPFDK